MVNGSSEVPDISWNSTISAETTSYHNGTYSSVLQFDPLRESHRDHYRCSVPIADIVREEIFSLTVQGTYFLMLMCAIIVTTFNIP